ncbi:MAG: hypothetical protein ACOH2D_09215 [Gelidibacter sp.]|uniref:hypothetical protein n=1 Tax=Gelidibacter sp. TaxID=2018083 RepID=UPI003266A2DB
MKLLVLIVITIVFIACNEHKNSIHNSSADKKDKSLKLNGVWELVSYYHYVNNKIADSFKTYHGFRQVKMYTDTKVMWNKSVPSDSIEWFGYGNYSLDDGNVELTETLEYGSEMMRRIIQEKKEFKYEISLGRNKFSQIEVDNKGNRLYSENYRRIE